MQGTGGGSRTEHDGNLRTCREELGKDLGGAASKAGGKPKGHDPCTPSTGRTRVLSPDVMNICCRLTFSRTVTC